MEIPFSKYSIGYPYIVSMILNVKDLNGKPGKQLPSCQKPFERDNSKNKQIKLINDSPQTSHKYDGLSP